MHPNRTARADSEARTARRAFTVVLPTHERPQFLGRAIQSVLRQTLEDFELIVVDDASGPETRTVVAQFEDPRLVYLRNDHNLGAAGSRNRAIQRAAGRVVAFLDDDDEYLPEFLAAHNQLFDSSPPDLGFAWCGAETVEYDERGGRRVTRGVWNPQVRSREEAHLLFLGYRQLGTSGGVTIRRSCFEEVGLFDDRLRRAEDTDLLPRLAQRFDFGVLDKILIRIHHHQTGRLTEYGPEMAAAYRHILSNHLPTLERHPRLWRDLHYKTGWLHYHGGDRRSGRKYLLKALKHHPFHWKTLGALLLFELLGKKAPRVHRELSALKDRWHQTRATGSETWRGEPR